MTRCTNTRCKWHQADAPTGCTLFGGKSWMDCRTKIVASRQVRSDSAGAMSSQTSPSIARSYVIAANATEKLKGAKQ